MLVESLRGEEEHSVSDRREKKLLEERKLLDRVCRKEFSRGGKSDRPKRQHLREKRRFQREGRGGNLYRIVAEEEWGSLESCLKQGKGSKPPHKQKDRPARPAAYYSEKDSARGERGKQKRIAAGISVRGWFRTGKGP